MRRIILATHGEFAAGILNSAEIIIGKSEQVQTLCAFTDPTKDFQKQVQTIVEEIQPGDELVVVTDILGGSVNNEFMRYLDHEGLHLISGLNLPLLIELILSTEPDTEKLIGELLEQMPKQIQYCNRIEFEEIPEEF